MGDLFHSRLFWIGFGVVFLSLFLHHRHLNPVNLTQTTSDAIYPAWIPAEAASAIRAAAWGAIKARIDRSGTSGAPASR